MSDIELSLEERVERLENLMIHRHKTLEINYHKKASVLGKNLLDAISEEKLDGLSHKEALKTIKESGKLHRNEIKRLKEEYGIADAREEVEG